MNIVNVSGLRPRRGAGYVAAILGVMSLATAAVAQPDVRSMRVVFKDLDLRTPAGAQRLLRRFDYAADAVCGDNSVHELAEREQFRACRREAFERAVRELDSPMVSALAHRTAEPRVLAGN